MIETCSVLIINSGSSSLKFAIIDKNNNTLADGIIDRLESPLGSLNIHYQDQKTTITIENATHEMALLSIKTWLNQHPILNDSIKGIGHRIVHGGENFQQSVVIDDEVLHSINQCSNLAPLHNPAHVKGIEVAKQLFPALFQVAVFDTAFHQTLSQERYLYSIPMRFYRDYKFRKYGFHGTSFRFVIEQLIQYTPDASQHGVLIAHLGNGASVCSIQNGQSQDTSMGLTPLDGLMMGTRSGSIDPSLISFMMASDNLTINQAMDTLNKQSGLLGISELSNDCRSLEQAMNEGNAKAKLALDMFCSRAASQLMSVATALDSIDHLVFTGGIGENSRYVRAKVTAHLKAFHFHLDMNKNAMVKHSDQKEISSPQSSCKIWVIPTNEESMIAMDTFKLISAQTSQQQPTQKEQP